MAPTASVSVEAHWPGVAGDLTAVTWAHAVNSRHALNAALVQDSIMMLEADVSVGGLEGVPPSQGSRPPLAIMAHPPNKTSDLSLKTFVHNVIQITTRSCAKKGIKLDFKDIRAAEEALPVLRELQDQISFPVWLNADIATGPGGDAVRVDPTRFLRLCRELQPGRTISAGWTTRHQDDPSPYSREQVTAMASLISGHGHPHGAAPTFAVRAANAIRSVDTLRWLLDHSGPASTLTVWHSVEDDSLVSGRDLADFVISVGRNRTYVDVPSSIYVEMRRRMSDGCG